MRMKGGTGVGYPGARKATTRPSPVSLRKNGRKAPVEPDGSGPSQPANERAPDPRVPSGVVPRAKLGSSSRGH